MRIGIAGKSPEVNFICIQCQSSIGIYTALQVYSSVSHRRIAIYLQVGLVRACGFIAVAIQADISGKFTSAANNHEGCPAMVGV